MSGPTFRAPRVAIGAAAVLLAGVLAGSSFSASSQGSITIAELGSRAAVLERDIAQLEDQNAIEKLQRIYGFYTDKQMWTQAADLFAANGTIEVGSRGVYVGRDRVLEFLKLAGPEFPQPGRLFDQMQLQPIVHVAPDGLTANGRWHMFAQEAVHGEYANLGLGVFENQYVKEGGVWKIQSLHLYTTMYTPYEEGWGKTALPNPGPSSEVPPDRPPSVDYAPFPATFVVPFHYENPVTGGPANGDRRLAVARPIRERRRRRRCARRARAAPGLARGRDAARAYELDLRVLPRAFAVGRPHGHLRARGLRSRSRCAVSTSAPRASAAI